MRVPSTLTLRGGEACEPDLYPLLMALFRQGEGVGGAWPQPQPRLTRPLESLGGPAGQPPAEWTPLLPRSQGFFPTGRYWYISRSLFENLRKSLRRELGAKSLWAYQVLNAVQANLKSASAETVPVDRGALEFLRLKFPALYAELFGAPKPPTPEIRQHLPTTPISVVGFSPIVQGQASQNTQPFKWPERQETRLSSFRPASKNNTMRAAATSRSASTTEEGIATTSELAATTQEVVASTEEVVATSEEVVATTQEVVAEVVTDTPEVVADTPEVVATTEEEVAFATTEAIDILDSVIDTISSEIEDDSAHESAPITTFRVKAALIDDEPLNNPTTTPAATTTAAATTSDVVADVADTTSLQQRFEMDDSSFDFSDEGLIDDLMILDKELRGTELSRCGRSNYENLLRSDFCNLEDYQGTALELITAYKRLYQGFSNSESGAEAEAAINRYSRDLWSILDELNLLRFSPTTTPTTTPATTTWCATTFPSPLAFTTTPLSEGGRVINWRTVLIVLARYLLYVENLTKDHEPRRYPWIEEFQKSLEKLHIGFILSETFVSIDIQQAVQESLEELPEFFSLKDFVSAPKIQSHFRQAIYSNLLSFKKESADRFKTCDEAASIIIRDLLTKSVGGSGNGGGVPPSTTTTTPTQAVDSLMGAFDESLDQNPLWIWICGSDVGRRCRSWGDPIGMWRSEVQQICRFLYRAQKIAKTHNIAHYEAEILSLQKKFENLLNEILINWSFRNDDEAFEGTTPFTTTPAATTPGATTPFATTPGATTPSPRPARSILSGGMSLPDQYSEEDLNIFMSLARSGVGFEDNERARHFLGQAGELWFLRRLRSHFLSSGEEPILLGDDAFSNFRKACQRLLAIARLGSDADETLFRRWIEIARQEVKKMSRAEDNSFSSKRALLIDLLEVYKENRRGRFLPKKKSSASKKILKDLSLMTSLQNLILSLLEVDGDDFPDFTELAAFNFSLEIIDDAVSNCERGARPKDRILQPTGLWTLWGIKQHAKSLSLRLNYGEEAANSATSVLCRNPENLSSFLPSIAAIATKAAII